MSLSSGKKMVVPQLSLTWWRLVKDTSVCPDLNNHFSNNTFLTGKRSSIPTYLSYCCTLLILTMCSTYLIYTQLKAIQQAFQEQGLSVSRTFATIGGAAVLGNLDKIQEAMEQYRQDPDLRFLEVVDENNIIVAALHPDRITLKLEDPFWITTTQLGKERSTLSDDQDLSLSCLSPSRYMTMAKLQAWVRLGFSLTSLAQKEREMMLGVIPLVLGLTGFCMWGIHYGFRKISPNFRMIISHLEELGLHNEK